MKDIVFVCGANDFHAMDKYWATAKAVHPRKVILLTDSIASEGQPKLISSNISVHTLFNIDRFLFKKQSSLSNVWRNFIKILFMPVQVYYLKRFFKKHSDCFYHAIPMYYMWLCSIGKIPFVATPQGSEILVRPFKSKIYRYFAIRSLQAASKVIVDSKMMHNTVLEISGVKPIIMKNGFDTSLALSKSKNSERKTILSIRGINPNYRIQEILIARNQSQKKPPISIVYPARDEDYMKIIENEFHSEDKDLGRLDRSSLYNIMGNTLLAISIPISDSSPRSVYECIFAGACVAVTPSLYIQELPQCMKDRIYIVDIKDINWFDKALEFAYKVTAISYSPSDEALDMCDQDRTIKKIIDKVYS